MTPRSSLEFPTATAPVPCENDGCSRTAAKGGRLCDTCELERALFRRDERPCLTNTPLRAER